MRRTCNFISKLNAKNILKCKQCFQNLILSPLRSSKIITVDFRISEYFSKYFENIIFSDLDLFYNSVPHNQARELTVCFVILFLRINNVWNRNEKHKLVSHEHSMKQVLCRLSSDFTFFSILVCTLESVFVKNIGNLEIWYFYAVKIYKKTFKLKDYY